MARRSGAALAAINGVHACRSAVGPAQAAFFTVGLFTAAFLAAAFFATGRAAVLAAGFFTAAAGVFEMGLAYVCQNSVTKPKTCDFRSGRIILQQEILPEQMVKLLNEGKTDLMPGFVSQRTRRPFKAFLVKGKDGKISFEFEPRKAKAPAKGKAAPVADEPEVEGAEATGVIKPAAKKAAAKKAPAKVAAKKPAAKKAPAKRAAAAKK